MKYPILICFLALVMATGPQSEEDKCAKEVAKLELQGPQSLMDGLLKLDNLSQLFQNGESVGKEPVNFRGLKTFLPASLGGLDRENEERETSGVIGFRVSVAGADYQSGNKPISLSLTDAGGILAALLGLGAWVMVSVDREAGRAALSGPIVSKGTLFTKNSAKIAKTASLAFWLLTGLSLRPKAAA